MRIHPYAAVAAGALYLGACASAPQPQAITLTARTMTYSPPAFEVVAGAPVELTFINEDALEHDFSILEIPVESVSEPDAMSAEHEMEMGAAAMDPVLHVAAEPGATNNLTFTPTKPGAYEFFCTVAGHKEAGMVGTMVVNAP
jgi:uncharacterized cupredoxin-like copper-binding protein